MMKMVVEIETGTDAFSGVRETDDVVQFNMVVELCRVLRELSETALYNGLASALGTLRDSNGELCGRVRLFDDDEELF